MPSDPAAQPTAYFLRDDTLCSRSVGAAVLAGRLAVPELPPHLPRDWERKIRTGLALEPGDVEPLSLARARMRWPGYRGCVQAVADWARAQGLEGLPGDSDVALMACRGARYHHDGVQYGGAAFCNLFLSDDRGLDVHFPLAGVRVPLARGTVMLFDTCQPHAVVPRGASRFEPAHFAPASDTSQVFLTWELSLDHAALRGALGIRLDVDRAGAKRLDAAQVRVGGAPVAPCEATGHWRPTPA